MWYLWIPAIIFVLYWYWRLGIILTIHAWYWSFDSTLTVKEDKTIISVFALIWPINIYIWGMCISKVWHLLPQTNNDNKGSVAKAIIKNSPKGKW